MGEKNHYYHLHTINVPDQIVLNHPLPFYLQHDQSRRTYNNKRVKGTGTLWEKYENFRQPESGSD